MFKRNLIVVWVGIIALSGMFLMGQDTWAPPPCTDLDGDGYGNPSSTLCTYPEWDCNDSTPDVHPTAEDLCGNMVDDDCDGQTDEECEGYTVKEYEILDTTISGTCDGMYALLGCSDAASCLNEIGMATSGSMEIEYTDDNVFIVMPQLSGSYAVDPVYYGTRTGETFSASSFVQVACFFVGTTTIYSTMSGGDVSSDSFSGTLGAQVIITGCGAFNGSCDIESNYTAQDAQ